jgi:hypothetical protein
VRSHLYVALDGGYLDNNTFDRLIAQAEETARILGGLRAFVAGERRKRTTAQDPGLAELMSQLVQIPIQRQRQTPIQSSIGGGEGER